MGREHQSPERGALCAPARVTTVKARDIRTEKMLASTLRHTSSLDGE